MKSVGEAIHDAIKQLTPYDEHKSQAKVNMGHALEVKALKRISNSNGVGLVNGVPDIYAGTANPNTVAKRRAKNKVARKSRKANR